MKKIYSILSFFVLLLMAACTSEEIAVKTDMGYLRLDVSTVTSTTTKGAVPENYDPKQLYVEILDAAGAVVASTENFANEWGNGKEFTLQSGTYIIKANSNGFDGSVSRYGADKPYYAGGDTVTVTANHAVTANVVCQLADVKVTVRFESSFSQSFKDAVVEIATTVANVTSLKFSMADQEYCGYLPVGDLSLSLRVRNFAGNVNTKDTTITDVQARDHYEFIYKVASTGEGSITVEADDSERTYAYTFKVTTTPSTTAKVETANAWSYFAYLSGSVSPKDVNTVIPATAVQFEYQLTTDDDESDPWTAVDAVADGTNTYKATVKGLTPGTGYRYRLVYTGDSETAVSSAKTFTTEAATALYNGGFENWWYKEVGSIISKHDLWYPNENENVSFWDTSNPGSADYIGSVTTKSTNAHSGNYSAELASTYAVIKFAAASLYTGKFGSLVGTDGAELDWGVSFASRPSCLHGYYQYKPGKINRGASNVPSNRLPSGVSKIVEDETDDWCSVYIVLTTKSFHVDNTDMDNFPVFANMGLSDGVIAYAELPISDCVNTNGNWKEFNLQLQYNDLTTKPTHMIIVCSSSKYGDYFTGSDSSVLYLDDLELVYGEPTLK